MWQLTPTLYTSTQLKRCLYLNLAFIRAANMYYAYASDHKTFEDFFFFSLSLRSAAENTF